MKHFPLFLIIALTFFGCNQHFLTDANYKTQVETDFAVRQEMAQHRATELFSVFEDKTLTLKEKEALQFLFAYMPLSDLADYDGDFFLHQTRYAFKAKEEMSWGKTIPEEIFRHFVLVYRVNNENLDTARMVIYNELKERIKDMSMYDAALEVNHWCHEKVTYRPADGRTSSPLASIRTGFGRCGEESTLTVTAMRAMGIPARQCYTPRWAHSDDNHAWVEVWIDGTWHFLGACEPDPELDMGWFAIPATRAMMVHSNVFGKCDNLGEKNLETNLYSVVNMLSNYTKTKKIKVIVADENNAPIKDATVKFKLYNYAEYYPLATMTTDENGATYLTTGFGDLLIWANKDEVYNYQKFDVRELDEMRIVLSKTSGKEYVELLDIYPPEAGTEKKDCSQEKKDLNGRRLQYEDSLRNAYLSTFMTEDVAKQIVTQNLTPEQVWYFIKKSEGNYAEIKKFIEQNGNKENGLFVNEFLNSLSDKDLRDAPADILQSHLTFYDSKEKSYEERANELIFRDFTLDIKHPFDVYLKGIISPRIANELIRDWRGYLKEKFCEPLFMEKSDESSITINPINSNTVKNWILQNIELRDDNYYRAPISPKGVFDLRIADKHSRNIFFVACCRASGIPAYLDGANNRLYAWEDGKWHTILFEATGHAPLSNTETKYGKLVLTLPKGAKKPEYWIHYTIAKFENGDFVTFDYEDDPRVAYFPTNLYLEPGYYMLSTGHRYSDGVTLSQLEFFNIEAKKTVTKTITLRELTPRIKNYGNIELTKSFTIQNTSRSIKELIGEKELVLAFIDPTREPTRHLFNDIVPLKHEFEKWNGNILFLIPSDKFTKDFDPKRWNLPKNIIFAIDENSTYMNQLLASTKQEFREEYPLVYIVNKDGNLTFKSEGYRVGTGELILKSLK